MREIPLLLFVAMVLCSCAPILISDLNADRADARLIALIQESGVIDSEHAGVIGLLTDEKGFVRSVLWNSPAREAKIKWGDQVTAVNGRPFDAGMPGFSGIPGTKVLLTIMRDGESRDIELIRLHWRAVFEQPPLQPKDPKLPAWPS